MGLSSEERLKKFYWRMHWMRQKLLELRRVIPNEGSHEHSLELVDGWIDTVNEMAGSMIESTDTSGIYWFAGAPEGNFQSIWQSTWNLGQQDELESLGEDLPGAEFRQSENRFGYMAGAKAWGGTQTREQSVILGAWWDMWQQISATLYPVKRYKDKLFMKIDRQLRLLIGEMANTRFELSCPKWGPDINEENILEMAKIEQALLCRVRMVSELAEPMSYGKSPTLAQQKFLDEISKNPNIGSTFADFHMMRNSDPSDSDFREVVEYVGSLSLIEVKRKLEAIDDKRAKERWERENKYNEEHSRERVDCILGPPPPSSEQLRESILDEDAPMSKRREAVNLLWDAHSISFNPLPKEEE